MHTEAKHPPGLAMTESSVRAVILGLKTQTRRKIGTLRGGWSHSVIDDEGWPHVTRGGEDRRRPAQLGNPGDVLWVREATWLSECGAFRAFPGPSPLHRSDVVSESTTYRNELASEEPRLRGAHLVDGFSGDEPDCRFAFRLADCDPAVPSRAPLPLSARWVKFRRMSPAMLMPRWASRMSLDLRGVRAERLGDISDSDVLAEGVPESHGEALAAGLPVQELGPYMWERIMAPRERYAWLWERLHGAGSWNPSEPVWVLTFRPVIDDRFRALRAVLAAQHPELGTYVEPWLGDESMMDTLALLCVGRAVRTAGLLAVSDGSQVRVLDVAGAGKPPSLLYSGDMFEACRIFLGAATVRASSYKPEIVPASEICRGDAVVLAGSYGVDSVDDATRRTSSRGSELVCIELNGSHPYAARHLFEPDERVVRMAAEGSHGR